MIQNATGVSRTEQPLTMALERVEDMLQLDSRTGLARLSEDTGGFLIEGSNDLSAALPAHRRRQPVPLPAHLLAEERRLRRQVPGDSGERCTARACRCSHARDTARSARRRWPTRPTTISPALALLDRDAAAERVPVHAAGFNFPDAARPGLTPVLVHVGTDALRFDIDARRVDVLGAGGHRRPHPRRAGPRSAEGQPAVPAGRRRQGPRGGQAGRDPLLPRARSASWRLHAWNRSSSTLSRNRAACASPR